MQKSNDAEKNQPTDNDKERQSQTAPQQRFSQGEQAFKHPSPEDASGAGEEQEDEDGDEGNGVTSQQKNSNNDRGKDAMRSGQPEGPGSERGRGNDQGE